MPGRAIVTGASRGIGKATAVALAHRGFDIGITWNESEGGAEDTLREVKEVGVGCHSRQMDLRDLPDDTRTVDVLAADLGGLDVLVNNAGGAQPHSFLDYPWEEWRQAIDLNLSGAFLCAQRAAKIMVEQGSGGRIVNVTSVHEHIPKHGASGYCAAKGGLGMLTKVMALELTRHRITVNSVAPGEIATRMTGNEDEDPDEIERSNIPAGRPGDAYEIAATIAFLASEEASYATGASFVVDGGLTLMAAEA
jgi:NAD(P)-dependent dehydrogenase (short-subunit alcohol dehydrogenase family)